MFCSRECNIVLVIHVNKIFLACSRGLFLWVRALLKGATCAARALLERIDIYRQPGKWSEKIGTQPRSTLQMKTEIKIEIALTTTSSQSTPAISSGKGFWQTESGMIPVKSFPSNSSVFMKNGLPILVGIVPVKLLSDKISFCRITRSPSSDGTVPVRPHDAAEKTWSDPTDATSEGIVPV